MYIFFVIQQSTSEANDERERRVSMDSAYQKQQQQMAEQIRQTNQLYQEIQRNIVTQQSAMQQRNNIREHIRTKPPPGHDDFSKANNNNNNNNPNVSNNNLSLQNKMAQYALHQMSPSKKMLDTLNHQKYYSKRKMINQYEKEQMQQEKRNRMANVMDDANKNYKMAIDDVREIRDSPGIQNHIKAEPDYDHDEGHESGTDNGMNYSSGSAMTPPVSGTNGGTGVNSIADKIRHSILEPNIVLHQQGEDMLTSAKATLTGGTNKAMTATS